MKQSERSKQWMADALLILIKDTPYEQISITNITEKAGVSRLTFYRNFESKEDILRFHFDRVFSAYIASVQVDEFDLEQALCQCFRFWQNLKSDIKVYLKNDLHRVMYHPMEQYLNIVLSKGQYNNAFTQIQKTFIVGGLFATMVSFTEEQSEQSPEEMASAVLEILNTKMV
ncbi:MAG: TetR/AcrR family transcriptional regulator [Eubacteriales bacterium]